ncbi:MAG: SpoIIE family protein phosphatase [Actinobacteria bacterium]|nr:SpoIIE family protein phosphatase [Actinomycetota bacterium]
MLEDDADLLYERAPCGYLSTTPNGTIVKVNQTFLTLTGYDGTELVGRRTFAELLTPGGRIYHETHYAPMLQMQGKAREIALEIVCADGRRLPVLVNAVLERGDDGSPHVVRTAVFDATERREYERELLRAKDRAEESERQARLLARTLQQTLIPPTPPAIPGLDIAAVYRPAGAGEEVGGDFYDVFQLAEDDWVMAIGDVCGKGVDAAVVTALARYAIRAAAVQQPGPDAVLHALNEVLLRHDSDRFCTVALVRLQRVDGRWTATVCSGGHPLPLLLRDGKATHAGGPGSLLGVLPQPTFHETVMALQPGDAIVLYTDGVTEARRGTDFFDEPGLVRSVAACATSASAITDGVLADVLAFQGDNPRDDIAVVAVRVP